MNIILIAIVGFLGIIGYVAIGGAVSRLAWWVWPLKGRWTVIRFLFFPVTVLDGLVGVKADEPIELAKYFEEGKEGKKDDYIRSSALLWPLRIIWLPIVACVGFVLAFFCILAVIAENILVPLLMKAYKTLVTPTFRRKKQPPAELPLSSVSHALPVAAAADLRVPRSDDQRTSQPA